jgi:endonuclease/exonuclease/phosphatase (EEP) superfamily protein YafD
MQQPDKENKLKKIGLSILYFINIVCLLLLICSNLAQFLNPSQWWMIALTGLAFPLFLLVSFAFAVFWLFVNRGKAIPSLLIILLSIPNIKRSFAFHSSAGFSAIKTKDNIRVVTWNVGLMNYETMDSATASDNNALIFNSLEELNPDVICLQEFFTGIAPGSRYNLIDSVTHSLHYPYHYFSYDRSQFNGSFYSGSIIFSKYKIVDSSKIIFAPFPGSVIRAGLLINNDTINIITTRLQSFHLEDEDYTAIHDIKHASAEGLRDSKSILHKIKGAYALKVQQIDTVQQLINNSKRPVIFTGDLNDVPSSYTYPNIKNNLSDAWLDKGFGIGRTFRFISPTLRIDYIFYDDFFDAVQTRRILTESSDHNGLVADFIIKKKG